ncbi:MAG: EAL domain-containing protein, partial [Oscillospiraceae bacterium]
MYNRATLAAKTCKGNYVDFYAYYTESMSSALASEQAITNEMNFALENGQFQIYLQPQYNIHTNSPCGAEALVRWFHPQKGMLSPGVFIPVFERNGFISKLDYYVWEQACKCLHAWKLKGLVPYPISVNISRVNIYNPNLVSLLLELVKRYELEPSLLKLELTESAYTDSPIAMKKIMSQLQKLGFTIMMDDFGSGYSSLSMLKDILVDVLKIDMTFLSKTEIPGRGENIIASVIRMAKWLSIPVIAEGAETAEQVDFLRSVGCDYVQGYYFARPMPVAEYEKLCLSGLPSGILGVEQKQSGYQYDNLFAFKDEVKSLFSNALQPAAIYEFADDKIEIIRVNEAYYSLLGHDDMLAKSANVLSLVDADYRLLVLNAFRSCVSCGTSNCEYTRIRPNANPLWLHTTLSYTSTVGNKHIIIGEITDITLHKAVDYEIQKYKNSWLDRKHSTLTALIVDDVKINRTILKKILQDKFLFLEAENGEQAIKVLRATKNRVDLIFLDVSMPVMDGKEFLLYKKNLPELDSIPVIMITGDDSGELQSSTFALGASDYIIKPFIPAVVTRRVSNVLEANQRFKDMVREYNAMSAQVKTDLATGLMSKIGAQEKISSYFESHKGLGVLAILDMDSFKNINELFGHDYGDEMICAVADLLKLNFRKEDVVARISEDSFLIFIGELDSPKPAIDKLHGIINDVSRIKVSKENVNLTCSIGAAASDEEFHSFDALYKNADKALYRAKCKGGNALALYDDDAQNGSVVPWINDAGSVLDAINDSIYACDRDNY